MAFTFATNKGPRHLKTAQKYLFMAKNALTTFLAIFYITRNIQMFFSPRGNKLVRKK